MKYFKNQNNEIFAFKNDGSQDEFIGLNYQPITNEELEQLISDRQKKQDESRTYAEKRLLEYPSIGDQLDALWKGGAVLAQMADQIKSVKEKYPKTGPT